MVEAYKIIETDAGYFLSFRNHYKDINTTGTPFRAERFFDGDIETKEDKKYFDDILKRLDALGKKYKIYKLNYELVEVIIERDD